MSLGLTVVRSLARAACWLFYRVDQVGSPPRTGPLLLVANHANALLDPAIVWTTAGRDVRFLAKSPLFDGPLRPFLAAAGAIPVYRRKDEGVDMSRNAEMFTAVDAALRAGDAVCIFPEGMSHSQGRLAQLRTGAARIVLAAESAGATVSVVAVGLNFDRKTAFRSRVTVAYGPAFRAAEFVPASLDDAGAVRALTDGITARMKRLLVEADPVTDAQLVDRIDRLYAAARGLPQAADERIARRQTIVDGIERLRQQDAARYAEILVRVRRYGQRLQRFGLRDRDLDVNVSVADAMHFAFREAALAIVLGPIAVAGLVLFFVPYWLTDVAARLATRESDVTASAKVIAGAIVYSVWLGVLVAAAWLLRGPLAALAVAALLPAVAVAALFALERESAVLDAARAWLLVERSPTRTRALRRQRSDLADVFDDVYDWLENENGDTQHFAKTDTPVKC